MPQTTGIWLYRPSAPLAAFQLRFERELISRWDDLKYEAAGGIAGAPPDKKHATLSGFFERAEKAIASVIHEYFPKLLQVAMAQRQHLANESPLSWTRTQVLREVCDFLGVDEKFDHTSAPRDDSRLLITTVQLARGAGWPEDPIPSDFVLPGWLNGRWIISRVLLPTDLRRNDDAESLPPLSRKETLDWIKQREFWISRVVETQIELDCWDGVIEAGKSGVSVLDAFVAGQARGNEPIKTPGRRENSFVKEAATWAISFDDETCRLRLMNGLDYIALLLQNPGKPIRAGDLLTLAGGISTGAFGDRASVSWNDDHSAERNDDQDLCYRDQSDFGPHEMIDDKTRREVERELSDTEREIVYFQDSRDMEKVARLQERFADLQLYLRGGLNIYRRPRVFSNNNEKARTSITNALKRAYAGIRAQAPKTAMYLKSNISTGSEFVYRDASMAWIVRREF